ncbi:cytochrome c biogenesis protein CcsA [Thermodesulfobacteriota bacterium]
MNQEKIEFAKKMMQTVGNYTFTAYTILSAVLLIFVFLSYIRNEKKDEKISEYLTYTISGLFLLTYFLIMWFHYQIYLYLPLELSEKGVNLFNKWLPQAVPQIEPFVYLDYANPLRYKIPLWIENERLFCWFLCYSIFAVLINLKSKKTKFKATINLFLALQIFLLYFTSNPFVDPLKKFFGELTPFINAPDEVRIRMIFQLYPRMKFYYNAFYMWLHPPMLFLAYASLTVTFISSLFMFGSRDKEYEKTGYTYAKLGYILLTAGMLVGYPWAIEAWGENWWWDPKICASIMMWLFYSAYLHIRIYSYKDKMWYFSAILGVLCYASLVFTYVMSYYFKGEHTF